MRKSLKQLLRTPVKTAIFFLLILAVSVLLTFFVCTVYGIYAAYYGDGGTIHNAWHNRTATALLCDNKRVGKLLHEANGLYGRPICRGHFARRVDFPEAEYVTNPETRPYFLAEQPGALCIRRVFPGDIRWRNSRCWTRLQNTARCGCAWKPCIARRRRQMKSCVLAMRSRCVCVPARKKCGTCRRSE